jgi:hypothetical protein
MNRVTSHLPITHKDVRSTTSKTVVWKEGAQCFPPH